MRFKDFFWRFSIPFVCFFFVFAHTALAAQVARWEIVNERLEIALDGGGVYRFDKTKTGEDEFYKVQGLPSRTQFTLPQGWSVDTDPRIAKRQGNEGAEQELGEHSVRFSSGATVLLLSDAAEMTARYSGPASPPPNPPAVTEKFPMIAAHYVTWFQTPEISGQYAFRWTLRKKPEVPGEGHFEPDHTIDGQAEIASYQYPLTGPYDSRDKDLLRYHMALMKMSGIDAVIIDFYGIHSDGGEYLATLESAKALVEAIEEAGLKFLICYEEQAVGNVVEHMKRQGKEIGHTEKVRQDFSWLGSKWFSRASYVKHGTRPVVLCFNNALIKERDKETGEWRIKEDHRIFKSLSAWKNVFASAGQNPLFIDLWNSLDDSEGAFHWFVAAEPHEDLRGLAMSNRIRSEVGKFFESQKSKPYVVSGAFAAFDDKIFIEVGQSNGPHAILRYDGGATFKSSLSESLSGGGLRVPDMIQLATWNDFAEGSAIEPSVDGCKYHRESEDRGYGPLDHLQKVRAERDDRFRQIGWTNEDLRAPIELYKLSKSGGNKDEIERVYKALFSGDPVRFRSMAKALVKYDMSVRPLLRNGSTPPPNNPPSGPDVPPSGPDVPPVTPQPLPSPNPGGANSDAGGGGCATGWGFSALPALLTLLASGIRRRN